MRKLLTSCGLIRYGSFWDTHGNLKVQSRIRSAQIITMPGKVKQKENWFNQHGFKVK